MIKNHGLWNTIIYYNVIPYTLIAFAIFFLRDYLVAYFCAYSSLGAFKEFYPYLKTGIPAGALLLLVVFFYMSARNKRYTFLTGRKYGYDTGHYKRGYTELVDYFKNAEPHKLDTSVFPFLKWKDTHGLIFGLDGDRLVSIPSDSECNIAIFGPPGSGKTSGIAIINAMQFEGSVLAIDIKGDLYNYVKQHSNRNIIRFAPDAPDALSISCRYDPLSGFENLSETEQKLFLENMAIILIADEGGSEGNYFTTRARKIFQGIAHLILFWNPHASFPDIVHAILQGNIFNWVEEAMASECTASKELLESFYGNNEKNVSGAYDALTTALVHFSNPILDQLLAKGSNCISIANLEEGSDIYLQISQEHLDAYAPLFTLLLQSFSSAFTKRPDSSTGAKNRPILMLMDEFPQLTFSYKMINSILSTLRSKSVICMVIQQNLSQLEYRYQPAGTRSILGNCNYQIILGSNDINSSKVFSETFGMKKVLRITNSITHASQESSGKSVQEAEERVFPPEYFGDLSSKSSLIIYFKGKYAELTKLNCYNP